MKNYFSILLILQIPLHLIAQEKLTKSYYNKWLVSLTSDGSFVLFTLNVKKDDSTNFKVVTSNSGLHTYYYSDIDYFREMPKIIEDILELPYLEEKKFPRIADSKIDFALYDNISHQRIKRVIKKYLFKPGDKKGSLRRVKENYLSSPELLTVLAFLSEKNFIITSDIDGYAIYQLTKAMVLPNGL